MIATQIKTLTALEAQAAANLFLSDNLPDRFCADDPRFDRIANLWRVPVVLAYPFIGSIGQVGEIVVSPSSEDILSHTPLEEMRAAAKPLIELHRDAIEEPFTSARIPALTAFEAEAAASLFLFDHLPDRFCPGQPKLDTPANLWHVPVLLSYPFIGPVGEVGEITVSASEEKIISHTPIDEMKTLAFKVYEERRADIETAFSQAGNA